jgi:hypothetical protein
MAMKTKTILALAGGLAVLATASEAAAFDARNPADVLATLSGNGATGELKKDDKGRPYIDAKAGSLTFEIDFYGCGSNDAGCSTTLYATGWNLTSVSIDQINRWNRWTFLCPAYLTTENHPHAWYGLRPSASETSADVAAELNIWLDCLSDFDKFTDAPEDFLKAHE